MSKAKEELVDLVRAALVRAEAIGDPDQLDHYAETVVDAVQNDEDRCGWLIADGSVMQVEETSLRDPGDENWTYEVYCFVPEDGAGDGE